MELKRVRLHEDDALTQAGFTAEAWFHISLYRNGLILTRLDDDTDSAALVAELGGSDTDGADWVGDNGELTLAGDRLTQSGLLTRRSALKP